MLQKISLFLILILMSVACGQKDDSVESPGKAADATHAEPEAPRVYTPAPPVAMMKPVQTGEVSGTRKVGEWTVGPELAPGESAVSDTILEAFGVGDYQGLPGATLTAVRTANEPGAKAAGDFALKVTREESGVSGVAFGKTRIQLKAGRQYLLRCQIHGGDAVASYRMSMVEDVAEDGEGLPIVSSEGREVFATQAGQWTAVTGIFGVSGDGDLLASLRIVRDGETADAWYFDGVSICEIIE